MTIIIENGTEPITTLGGDVTGPSNNNVAQKSSATLFTGAIGDKGGQFFNVLAYNAKGDGVTNDTPSIQAAINAASLVNGTVIIPPTLNGYLCNPAGGSGTVNDPYWALSLPSGISLDGYGWLTANPATHSSFHFAHNAGWETDTADTNIRVSTIRFHRQTALGGDEGPYDGALAFRNVTSGLEVKDVITESGMSGVVIEGCQGYDIDNVTGYSQGDCTVRAVWSGALLPYALGGHVAHCYSVNAGYALDGVTPIPQPSGPTGDAYICTQSGVNWTDNIAVNPRHNAFETGNGLIGMMVDGLLAYSDIAGRACQILIAKTIGAFINNIEIELHNGATGALNIVGTPGNVNSDIVIDGVNGYNDYVAAGTDITLVSVGNYSSDVRVRNVNCYGGKVSLGGTAGNAIYGENITVEMTAKAGINTQTATDVQLFRCVAINCGNDSTQASTDRCGFILQAVSGRVENCQAIENRAGAARTQQFGFYVVSGSYTWINNDPGNNNVTAAFHYTAGTLTEATVPTVTTAGGNYNTVATDRMVLADATGGPFQVHLRGLAANTSGSDIGRIGRRIVVKKIDASVNAVTVNASPTGPTFDGAASVALVTQYQSVDCIFDGTNWDIVT